jgi:hypothetical protein
MNCKMHSSVKQDGCLKAFRVVRGVKDQSLTTLNTSQFTDVGNAFCGRSDKINVLFASVLSL